MSLLLQGDRGFRGDKGKKGDQGETGEPGIIGPLVLDSVVFRQMIISCSHYHIVNGNHASKSAVNGLFPLLPPGLGIMFHL